MKCSLFFFSITAVFSLVLGQYVFFTCQLYQYKFVNETKTWTEAQEHCRKTFTDLATVYDMADMRRLRRDLKKNENGEAWIGLYNGHSLKWHWSLPGVEYHENQSRWGPNERVDTTESCAQIQNHKWQDITCSHQHYFICYDGESM